MKKIKLFFKNLVTRFISKPYYEFVTKKAAIKARKKAIKDFERDLHTEVEKVKKIMYNPKFNHGNFDLSARREFLDTELKEARNKILKFSSYTGRIPFFYEPEIIDVHNENLRISNNKSTLKEIMKRDNTTAELAIKKQVSIHGNMDKKYIPRDFSALNTHNFGTFQSVSGDILDGYE